MNASIIKISAQAYAGLVMAVMPENKRKELLEAISESDLKRDQNEAPTKPLTRSFMESFVKKVGEEAGTKSIRLAFLLLSGGLSEVGPRIEFIKDVWAGKSEK